MSYFDISAAEVRSLAFFSKDPKLCEKFLTGQDPYLYVARTAFPNGQWDDPGYKRLWRTRFKSILLGKMYLMSDQTLANNTGLSIEEAQHLTELLFSEFNVVKKFIDKQSNYPLSHDGRINTFLGDDLISPDWEGYLRGEKQAKGRVMRHGVNLSIQGCSACYLAAGFYNCHRVARQNGLVVQPLIVVDRCDFM